MRMIHLTRLANQRMQFSIRSTQRTRKNQTFSAGKNCRSATYQTREPSAFVSGCASETGIEHNRARDMPISIKEKMLFVDVSRFQISIDGPSPDIDRPIWHQELVCCPCLGQKAGFASHNSRGF